MDSIYMKSAIAEAEKAYAEGETLRFIPLSEVLG